MDGVVRGGDSGVEQRPVERLGLREDEAEANDHEEADPERGCVAGQEGPVEARRADSDGAVRDLGVSNPGRDAAGAAEHGRCAHMMCKKSKKNIINDV